MNIPVFAFTAEAGPHLPSPDGSMAELTLDGGFDPPTVRTEESGSAFDAAVVLRQTSTERH